MAFRYVVMKSLPTASPAVKEVLEEVRQDFGLISEPLLLQAATPPVLAAAWACLREGVIVCREVPRPVKETVAAVISQANECRYCVDAHSSLLHSAGRREAAWGLRRGGRAALADEDLRAAAEWAAATRSPGAAILAAPPFAAPALAEMIATAGCFHYINRLVTVFLGETPFPLPWRWLAAPMVLLGSRLFAPAVRRKPAPGLSVARLPADELAPDLAWASPRPEIAAAFASMAVAVDAEAQRALGDSAGSVRARIAAWRGEDPPLGKAWLDDILAPLPEQDRAAARFSVLVALSPHRLTAEDVDSLRAAHAATSRRPEEGDAASFNRTLVGLATWASFTACRTMMGWLDPGLPAAPAVPSATSTAT